MIKAVIFDLDGTLAYTFDDIFNSFNLVRVHKGLRKVTREEFSTFQNGTTYELVTASLPKGQPDDYYKEAVDYYFKQYDIHYLDNTVAYDGMKEVLTYLKNEGYIVSILSNKDDYHTYMIAKTLYGDIFDDVVGPNNFPGKPDPSSSLYLCNKYNLNPREVLYIGDSDVDIKTANNANMQKICVTWGYKSKEYLMENGGENFASKPSDIIDIIKKLNK